MSALIGHAEIRRELGALLRKGAFPQTSLFYGVGGCGKKLVALELAKAVLCEAPAERDGIAAACGTCRPCAVFASGNHPDFHFVSDTPALSRSGSGPAKSKSAGRAADDGEDDAPAKKASGKSAGSIKTEQVVELKKKLAYPPLMGKFHVTVIDNADLMTETTANSLLKLLEEPREGQIFILVSGRFHRMLVTIRSRCAKFHFRGLDAAECKSVVAAAMAVSDGPGPDPALFDFYAACFPGSPALILEALRLPLGPSDFEAILARKDGFLAASDWAARVSDSGAELPLFLQCLRGYCLDRALAKGGADARDADFLDRIAAAEKRLEKHIPGDFVLENLFL